MAINMSKSLIASLLGYNPRNKRTTTSFFVTLHSEKSAFSQNALNEKKQSLRNKQVKNI